MADQPRRYSDEEMEAILRRALERQVAADDGYGHQELVAAAREVGLDEDAIRRATEEVQVERNVESVRSELARRRRARTQGHGATYLAIVGALLSLHALGLFGTWTVAVALLWGAVLALDVFGALRGPSEVKVQREVDRRNRRARRVANARARREARAQAQKERAAARRARKGGDFEALIQDGVAMLLDVAAKKVRDTSRPHHDGPQPDGPFARYVERQKAGATGSNARPAGNASSPPRVRVETSREESDEAAVSDREAARRRKQRR